MTTERFRETSIIVTGCGGDIGLCAGRILVESQLWREVVGTDMGTSHPGLSAFQSCAVLPRASDPGYVAALEKLVASKSASVVVPTSEPEIKQLLKLGLSDSIGGARLVLPNTRSQEIGFDKLATARLLESSSLPAPWTEVVGEGQPREFPCIIKSRFGAGSVDVAKVEAPFKAWYESHRTDSIWQEYLRPDDEEYTCALFKGQGALRTIVFKRVLQGGITKSGTVVQNESIERVLRALAETLQLRGSINAQLRLTARGPVIFEINPRFSSTLMFRHRIGFQDLMWAILDTSGEPLPEYRPAEAGISFFRTYGEFVLGPNGEVRR
jgi:carbamoyl-phosphate synthase large subunit